MIKEYTRPLEQGIDSDKNIFSVLEERVERTPDDNLVEYKTLRANGWRSPLRSSKTRSSPSPKDLSLVA